VEGAELIEVPVGEKSIEDYIEYVGTEQIERIKETAGTLSGLRVLHLSSTPYGGGVAELLNSLVPLMNCLGLDAHWQVLERDDGFFTITKILHNSLQGMGAEWTPELAEAYITKSREYAKSFKGSYDIVVIHDPQPAVIAGLLEEESRRSGAWIWRCHLDLSAPDPEALKLLNSLMTHCYECVIFTSAKFIPRDLQVDSTLMAPSIDPLNPKNMPLDPEVVREAVARYGLKPAPPMVVQVSRFDPWKDPLGVIDAVEIARQTVPDLQLVFIGSMANDDPEGYHYYRKTAERAADVPGVLLLTNVDGIGNLGVNAFQRAADVVLQKSIREGFGLTISEALWKSRAVVAGNVGGIPLQVEDGVNGFLVDSIEECADRIVRLLGDPEERERFGRAGRVKVRQQFLTTRHLEDYLNLFKRLSSAGAKREIRAD
jgi:trehalose synthase